MANRLVASGIARGCEIREATVVKSSTQGGVIMVWLKGSSIACYIPRELFWGIPAEARYPMKSGTYTCTWLIGRKVDVQIRHLVYDEDGHQWEQWTGRVIRLEGATESVDEPYLLGSRGK